MATGQRGLGVDRLKELAKGAAEKTLKQLRVEVIAIERTFPELALPRRGRYVVQAVKTAGKRGRRMSAAAKSAVSRRMKKYWKERKKAKKKVG